jgi:hypothetical protein
MSGWDLCTAQRLCRILLLLPLLRSELQAPTRSHRMRYSTQSPSSSWSSWLRSSTRKTLQPKIQFYTSWKLGSKMHSSPQSRAKPFKRLTRSVQRTCALSHDAKSVVGQLVLKSLRHHSANPAHPASSHASFELGFKQLPSQGWSLGCKSLPCKDGRTGRS